MQRQEEQIMVGRLRFGALCAFGDKNGSNSASCTFALDSIGEVFNTIGVHKHAQQAAHRKAAAEAARCPRRAKPEREDFRGDYRFQ
jgi:hypothetical protein